MFRRFEVKFPSRDGWAKFGFEGVLIVVSILLAFSIESWQTERALRAEEQRILRQLESEFEANAELLALRRQNQDRILKAATWILSVTGPSDDRVVDAELFYSRVFEATDWATFDPQDGVLQSLLQTDKLEVIKSEPLRAMLSAWPSMVRDIAEDEQMARDFSLGPLTTYLAEHAPLRNIQAVGMRDSPTGPSPGPSQFSGDIDGLLSDPVFENLIHQKLWLTMWVIVEYDSRAPAIGEILSVIESEIKS